MSPRATVLLGFLWSPRVAEQSTRLLNGIAADNVVAVKLHPQPPPQPVSCLSVRPRRPLGSRTFVARACQSAGSGPTVLC